MRFFGRWRLGFGAGVGRSRRLGGHAMSPQATIPAARAARRSARAGAAPAAIASSTDCGRSTTARRRRRRAREGLDALGLDAATDRDARHAGRRAPAARRRARSCRTPVWASIRPSPVITRSARASLPSKSVASITSSTPGPQRERREPVLDREQRRTRRRPPRRRPGVVALAPAGRAPRARRPTPRAARSSSIDVARASRPSAGRRRRPRRSARAAGSRRRRRPASSTSASRGSSRRGRDADRGRIGAERRRRPAPPSVVALPPMPSDDAAGRRRRCAARSSSPVPIVVAPIGSRSSRRDATARTPRPSRRRRALPSSERSQRASIGRPSGSRTSASATPSRRPPRSRRACPRRRRPAGEQDLVVGSRARPAVGERRATSTEVSEPLNESGAMRTVRRLAAWPPRSTEVLPEISRQVRASRRAHAWFGHDPELVPAERPVERVGGAAR